MKGCTAMIETLGALGQSARASNQGRGVQVRDKVIRWSHRWMNERDEPGLMKQTIVTLKAVLASRQRGVPSLRSLLPAARVRGGA
jgi:hypothetical protein